MAEINAAVESARQTWLAQITQLEAERDRALADRERLIKALRDIRLVAGAISALLDRLPTQHIPSKDRPDLELAKCKAIDVRERARSEIAATAQAIQSGEDSG